MPRPSGFTGSTKMVQTGASPTHAFLSAFSYALWEITAYLWVLLFCIKIVFNIAMFLNLPNPLNTLPRQLGAFLLHLCPIVVSKLQGGILAVSIRTGSRYPRQMLNPDSRENALMPIKFFLIWPYIQLSGSAHTYSQFLPAHIARSCNTLVVYAILSHGKGFISSLGLCHII